MREKMQCYRANFQP